MCGSRNCGPIAMNSPCTLIPKYGFEIMIDKVCNKTLREGARSERSKILYKPGVGNAERICDHLSFLFWLASCFSAC